MAGFLSGAAPVVLLGFSRGGYPVEVVAGYGIALWWLLAVGFLTDAVPRPRPTTAGWVALAAIVGLLAWGGLSLSWSSDPERGLVEVARLIVAAGSVLLGMSAARSGQSRALAGGVLAGLTLIITMAVLTRLFPALVPSASVTGEFLIGTERRLAWPLNYWNANAAATAMALPLALTLATRARHALTSALAAMTIPVLALGLAYTLSRGGIVAAGIGLAAALALVAPRAVVARTALVGGAGAAATLIAGVSPTALADVSGGVAQDVAGRRAFLVLLIATAGVGLVQGGLRSADQALWTPHIPRPRRRTGLAIVLTGTLVLAALAVQLDLPDRVGDGWDRFRDPQVTDSRSTDNTGARLSSLSGTGRYQLWTGAIDAFRENAGGGIGLGSWESWWNPRRGETDFVRNTHSEPLELLAETGALGGVLFLLFVGTPLVAGARSAFRRGSRSIDGVSVVPALAAFAVALVIDWNWQIGALMVAGVTLSAIPLSTASRDVQQPARPWPSRRRIGAAIGFALVSLASIATLATALVAPQAVNASRDAVARGDLSAAAAAAGEGEDALSFAATPALQRALVEERAGNLEEAERAARTAAERTPADWRPWFLVARIATSRGRDSAAIEAFRRARSLNPDSRLLAP